MITIDRMLDYLKEYNGRPIKLMEVCGSHTAAIAKSGIRDLLSDNIKLIGGPGCPVCVTPSEYVDKLIEIAKEPGNAVATFGDLMRVPGSVQGQSLGFAKSEGADVRMVYSPLDLIDMAKKEPEKCFIFAAVGFETTAPVYTVLMEECTKASIINVKLLTSLKTMPSVIGWLMDNGAGIDGFIAPGHVAAVTGSDYFIELSKKYNIPMAVTGFKDEELVVGIYGLVKMIDEGVSGVNNYYPQVVTDNGNLKAIDKMNKYYEPCDTSWRGMGVVQNSGLRIRDEYRGFDYGSSQILSDKKANSGCCCGQILMGRMEPKDCPLFGGVCTPQNPAGACMVSFEGGCYQHFINR